MSAEFIRLHDGIYYNMSTVTKITPASPVGTGNDVTFITGTGTLTFVDGSTFSATMEDMMIIWDAFDPMVGDYERARRTVLGEGYGMIGRNTLSDPNWTP